MNLLLMKNSSVKVENLKECEPLMCFVDKFIYFMSLSQKHLFYVFKMSVQLLKRLYKINNNIINYNQGCSSKDKQLQFFLKRNLGRTLFTTRIQAPTFGYLLS